MILDKLELIKERFEEVGRLLVQQDIASDQKRYSSLNKEYKDLDKIVQVYEAYKDLTDKVAQARVILETEKDPDFRELAKGELEELLPKIPEMEDEIKSMLVPKDPNDSKNIILEVRAGAGGDEASIFAGDIFRMYQRFCDKMGWKMDIIDFNLGTSGGYKEVICNVSGEDVYGMMKWESGVHRVQRVPATEAQGRVHTSAASVAVLPEVDDVEIVLNMGDIRKDFFCSSGAGGQSVNTTYSAVRLTHIPTGTVVQCQDERSQIKNMDRAMKVLRSRIYEIELAKHNEEIAGQRRTMVGSGDRSDKIRTYNYPQGRVTDHRIGYTVYNLPTVMEGEVGEFMNQLRMADNAEKLKEGASI
jgi:peptide chain release factor 1